MALEEQELRWDLSHLVRDEEHFNELSLEVRERLERFKEMTAVLKPEMTSKQFGELLDHDQKTKSAVAVLRAYSYLRLSQNNQDSKAERLNSLASTIAIETSSATRRFYHWLKGKTIENLSDKQRIEKLPGLDDQNAQRLFESYPLLTFFLQKTRLDATYALKENEENVLDGSESNLGEALLLLRSKKASSLEFTIKPGVWYRERVLKTESEIKALRRHKNAKVRRTAYVAHLSAFRDHLSEFFTIYQAIVKQWQFEAKQLRGFSSNISMANNANNISDKTVEQLMQACTDNLELYRKFFRLKAKMLGKEKLNRFDLYAPTSFGRVNKKVYSLEEAKKLTLETFKEISQKFLIEAKRFFEEGRIDSHPRKNKESGAFMLESMPGLIPYIMLNHQGTFNDVLTMAHEIGHGVHYNLSSHLPFNVYEPSLAISETASTLSEAMLFNKVFPELSNQEQKSMLFEQMSDSYVTIMRQIYFVKFELEAHRMIMEGTTPEELSEVYLKNLEEQFDDSVNLDPIMAYEWVTIPHIVESPFYCYSYSSGDLLAGTLVSEYKADPKRMLPKIEAILSAGSSVPPEQLLKEQGFDITQKEFWQRSFNLLKDKYQRLEELCLKQD